MLFNIPITALLLTSVSAHTWLTGPTDGGLRKFTYGVLCRGIDAANPSYKSPCCAKKETANPKVAIHQRGQQISITWPRNNHPGGIIELSVVPFANSDDSVQLYASNTFQVMCNEQNCKAGEFNRDPFGPDGPSGSPANTCSQTFTVPPFLANGEYTIMFRYLGAGGYFSNMDQQIGDFVTCYDFTVNGGPAATAKPASLCPLPKLGDVHSNDPMKCYFYGSGQIDACPQEGCVAPTKIATPPRFEQCWANGGQNIYGGNAGPAPSPSSSSTSPSQSASSSSTTNAGPSPSPPSGPTPSSSSSASTTGAGPSVSPSPPGAGPSVSPSPPGAGPSGPTPPPSSTTGSDSPVLPSPPSGSESSGSYPPGEGSTETPAPKHKKCRAHKSHA